MSALLAKINEELESISSYLIVHLDRISKSDMTELDAIALQIADYENHLLLKEITSWCKLIPRLVSQYPFNEFNDIIKLTVDKLPQGENQLTKLIELAKTKLTSYIAFNIENASVVSPHIPKTYKDEEKLLKALNEYQKLAFKKINSQYHVDLFVEDNEYFEMLMLSYINIVTDLIKYLNQVLSILNKIKLCSVEMITQTQQILATLIIEVPNEALMCQENSASDQKCNLSDEDFQADAIIIKTTKDTLIQWQNKKADIEQLMKKIDAVVNDDLPILLTALKKFEGQPTSSNDESTEQILYDVTSVANAHYTSPYAEPVNVHVVTHSTINSSSSHANILSSLSTDSKPSKPKQFQVTLRDINTDKVYGIIMGEDKHIPSKQDPSPTQKLDMTALQTTIKSLELDAATIDTTIPSTFLYSNYCKQMHYYQLLANEHLYNDQSTQALKALHTAMNFGNATLALLKVLPKLDTGLCHQLLKSCSEQIMKLTIAQSAAKRGFKCIDMNANGNCLFEALAHQIYLDSSHASIIRERIVQYIKDNFDIFKEFMTEESRDTFLEKMRQDQAWGNHITLVAAANFFDARIVILHSNNAKPTVINSAVTPTMTSLYLGYILESMHYISLVPDPDQIQARQDFEAELKQFAEDNSVIAKSIEPALSEPNTRPRLA